MSLHKKFLNQIGLVVFLFCAIFTPDFFPFSMRYIIVIFCGLYLCWDIIKKKKIKLNINFLEIFKYFIPFFIYLFLAQVLHIINDKANSDIYISTFTHSLSIFIAAFLIGYFLICACKDLKISQEKFWDIIMLVLFVQFVCVLLALIFPEVRNWFNSLVINNSYSDRLAQLAQASNAGRMDRSYGLSNNLFDSFGFITSMLIVLMFIVGNERKNNRLIIMSIVMIVVPLVNARTGLLLVFIGVFISMFYYINVKTFLKYCGLIPIFIILFALVLSKLPKTMLQWLLSGIEETKSLISGEGNIGVYSKLFESDYVYPNSILFGAGGSPKNIISYGIDNGYINCLWNFGLIGTFLLLFGYYHLFRMIYKNSVNKAGRAIAVSFATIFFVYLIKIYSLDNFGGITVVFGIASVMLTIKSIDNKSQ